MKLITKNYGDSNFITGLRGYAALIVVLIHSGGAGLREIGYFGNNIVDFGRTGVYAFFVISGFSISASFRDTKSFRTYICKRFLRIAPLYYLWVTICVVFSLRCSTWREEFNTKIDFYNIIMHLSFLSFLDYKIANSIIGVEWSIPIEIFWYFFLPALLIMCKRWILLIAMIFCSLIINDKCYSILLPLITNQETNSYLAIRWSPIPYLFSYLLGIAAFKIKSCNKITNKLGNITLVLIISIMFFYLYRPSVLLSIFKTDFYFTSFITFLLIVFGTKNSICYNALFCNPIILYIGTISYGIYLCHMPLISLLNKYDIGVINNKTEIFIMVLITSIIVSSFTYFLFERKFSTIKIRSTT